MEFGGEAMGLNPPWACQCFLPRKEQGGKNRAFQFCDGLVNYKDTMIYPGSGPSLKVIDLRPMV
jgi:hypothetical protein